MIYYFLFLLCIPLFIIYFFICFTIPVIKIGKVTNKGNIKLHIYKDTIHSDYVFESEYTQDIFPTQEKFTKIGWGDRKIFLETQSWDKLKLKDFLFAFFGLNHTVLRVDFLQEIPSRCRLLYIDDQQLRVIKEHIRSSFENKIIQKKSDYYQYGIFYESKLNYNCITNCNNWTNLGLRRAKLSNRLWCPLTFWI